MRIGVFFSLFLNCGSISHRVVCVLDLSYSDKLNQLRLCLVKSILTLLTYHIPFISSKQAKYKINQREMELHFVGEGKCLRNAYKIIKK